MPGGRRAPTGGPGVTAREEGRKEARGVADGLSRPMGWCGKEWADVAHAGKGRG
jgi:hypothetical protein